MEADESYFGGREKNKHFHKKLNAGRGAVGKTAVAAVRDRATGQIHAQVVERTNAATLVPFVAGNTEPGAKVYTTRRRRTSGYRTMKRSSMASGSASTGRRTSTAWSRSGAS